MSLVTPFYVSVGGINVPYTEVPSTSLNGKKYVKLTPDPSGAKSYFEIKVSEDGKGANAVLRYLISKVFEVLGPDNILRTAKVNLTVALPATSATVNRANLVDGSLQQILSFILTSPATIGSPDGPNEVIIPVDRISTILNGEI